MGCGDDGAHSQNEKIDVRNYIEGVSIVIFSLSPYCCVVQTFIWFSFILNNNLKPNHPFNFNWLLNSLNYCVFILSE